MFSRPSTCKHSCLAAFIALLYASPPAAMNAGDNSYCSNMRQGHFSVFSEALQDAELDGGNPADIDTLSYQSRGITSALVSSRNGNSSTSVGFDYSYTILSLDGSVKPDSNGHLHTFVIPVTGRQDSEEHTLTYYLAPALSVSSNALKDPGLIDTQALQLRAGLSYSKTVDAGRAWYAGLRADYRFGPYRLYPVAGYCWTAGEAWRLQLGLPDLSITRQFAGGISVGIYASPDGNSWHVFNKDRTRASELGYNAIVTGIYAGWRINGYVELSLGVINHGRRRLSYLDEAGVRHDTSASQATGYMASASIIF